MKKVEIFGINDRKLHFGEHFSENVDGFFLSFDNGKTALLPEDIEKIIGSDKYKIAKSIDDQGHIERGIDASYMQQEVNKKCSKSKF